MSARTTRNSNLTSVDIREAQLGYDQKRGRYYDPLFTAESAYKRVIHVRKSGTLYHPSHLYSTGNCTDDYLVHISFVISSVTKRLLLSPHTSALTS